MDPALSRQHVSGRPADEIEGDSASGDALVANETSTIDGAVAAWGVGSSASEEGKHRREGLCFHHISDEFKLSLYYDRGLFCRYPPGMPYDVKINSWKLVR